MKTVKIDNLIIGEGLPKIIVPLVAKTETEILEEARFLATVDCDIIEWRIDFFEKVSDFKATAVLSQQVKQLVEKPLLITFRSQREGGVTELTDEAYFSLYQEIVAEGAFDLLDVELFMPTVKVTALIAAVHEKGEKVILCNHDFQKTPAKNEIIDRLRKMQALQADICKIAVMPEKPADVLTLLAATQEMNQRYAEVPLITISMGKLGEISRIAGNTFGSAATFGVAKKASAPGQIPVADLRIILNTLQ
ncbi:3-dehydroquinate dehydratase-1 [Enterococcus sp. PF1-24]|uniref:type I 3-dehydroquinate dehydratase n=1 Tax=unclassified Enterococcus TaxID=2608891 RepID=UPI00247319F1|nr:MULTISPECIES: type I 3-dehydroquinate dehydratase [unclassified Enterococcus]MDH6363306.1 3-dehydroquinate dehydratase-1 [Enterococcus sp. PFB1-1]MDH6400393.1 3-dehydroquinate dehydratase-1 [Enterococcus sp. PF1-24]